jgi:hypothetical protein
MAATERYTRWAVFEQAILNKLEDPQKCRETVLRRQREVDDEACESELVSAYFRSQLRRHGQDPETCCLYWTTAEVTELLNTATGMRIAVNRATHYLRALSIPQLAYTKRDGVPGWVWRGPKANRRQHPVVFSKLPYAPPG